MTALTDAELKLLSCFLSARTPIDIRNEQVGVSSGNEVSHAIGRFFDMGLLQHAELVDVLNAEMGAADLKSQLKLRGLKVSGLKSDLVKRLVEFDHVGAKALVVGANALVCTERGAELVAKNLDVRRAAISVAQDRCLANLRDGNLWEACKCASRDGSARLVPSATGAPKTDDGFAANMSVLEDIFQVRPGILAGLPEPEWRDFRVAAAMGFLWGVNRTSKWISSEVKGHERFSHDVTARMLLFAAWAKRDERQLSTIGDQSAKGYFISGTSDSCDECKSLRSQRFSTLNVVPEIPHVNCKHKLGCRCSISVLS